MAELAAPPAAATATTLLSAGAHHAERIAAAAVHTLQFPDRAAPRAVEGITGPTRP